MLSISCGDKFYNFRNVLGTVYLFWAKRINEQTINRQENGINENVPVLIEKNGQHGFKNVFIFKEGNNKPTNKSDIHIHEPIGVDNIFCCEIDNIF